MNLLQNIYLFKELTEDELTQLAAVAKERDLSAGQDVFIRGDQASALYVVRHGVVQIKASTEEGDDIRIARIETGSHFGELPFLDGEIRSASAVALENTQLLEIPYTELRSLLDAHPMMSNKIYRSLATYLSGRLRATTRDLHAVREQNIRHF